jgi:hypothetical protein
MTPQQRREKVYRDALLGVAGMAIMERKYGDIAATAGSALAAADAIPDAPAANRDLTGVYQASAIATQSVPSRAELIDLMRDAYWCPIAEHRNETDMGKVLDALVKAGAVRDVR